MHSLIEIEAACSALANQLSAGIKLKEAVARLSKLQPKNADFWASCAEQLSRGIRLSFCLNDYWPESLVAAVKAGEESNSLQEVFSQSSKALRVNFEIKKVYSKLISPVIAFLAGIGMFMFFMIFVIPKLQTSLGGAETSLVFRLSSFLHHAFTEYWIMIAIIAAGLLFSFIAWIRTPQAIEYLVEQANKVPLLGPALRDLYFGLWAYQVAVLDAAGLSTKMQLLLSVKTLPVCFRDGVERMAAEVEKRGIADSSDPEKQDESDPRREWPFYIAAAFMTAHETGRIDLEMQRCAPILVEEGIKKITKFVSGADLFAKVSAAIMIGIPLLAYFSQMANSLTKAFSGV